MLNAGIMSEEEFDELVGTKEICVCDFSATWCGPCRMMAPILEDISEKYKGKYFFYQIDIDSAEELANRFNVTAVPTVIIFAKGKEIARLTGFREFDEMNTFIIDSIKKAN